MKKKLCFNGAEYDVEIMKDGDSFKVILDGESFVFDHYKMFGNKLIISSGGSKKIAVFQRKGKVTHVDVEGSTFEIQKPEKKFQKNEVQNDGSLTSPMPGKIIKVNFSIGDKVKKGEQVVVMEAMKMEHDLVAPRDGVIKSVAFGAGEIVEGGVSLIELEDQGDA